MRFARLTRLTFIAGTYQSAAIYINFDLVVAISEAVPGVGGSVIKFLLQDTGDEAATPTGRVRGTFGTVPVGGDKQMQLVTLVVRESVKEIMALLA
jgi:hypothetical protein